MGTASSLEEIYNYCNESYPEPVKGTPSELGDYFFIFSKANINYTSNYSGTNLFRNMMGIDYTDAFYLFVGAFLSTISDNANITKILSKFEFLCLCS
ncbi:hypothetical protein M9Y10_017860 [Tritrichomonas musculus]|uniref:Uncharacterized protein n=1 Tax=Tritrichomonas musculus TaxID=1915356 RepID=A0ABR2GP41_9EUKA